VPVIWVREVSVLVKLVARPPSRIAELMPKSSLNEPELKKVLGAAVTVKVKLPATVEKFVTPNCPSSGPVPKKVFAEGGVGVIPARESVKPSAVVQGVAKLPSGAAAQGAATAEGRLVTKSPPVARTAPARIPLVEIRLIGVSF
jgi:hypothetical protein